MKKISVFFYLFLIYTQLLANDLIVEAKFNQQNNNHQEAISFFYQAAKKDGSAEAIYELGKYFYEGKYINKNFDKAKLFFEQSSQKGFIEASYALGVLFFNSNSKYHSYEQAYDIFLDLAQNNNHAPSQNRVGMCLIYGFGVEKDYKEAVKWFEKSAKNGYITGQCHLALMYASGKGVFPNFGRARALAQKGYEEKNPICVQVWEMFKLDKYKEDKGFKQW